MKDINKKLSKFTANSGRITNNVNNIIKINSRVGKNVVKNINREILGRDE